MGNAASMQGCSIAAAAARRPRSAGRGSPPAVLLLALLLAPAAPATAQDAAAGQRAFRQCRACHSIDEGGRNGVGPSLHGIIGRRAAAVEGYRYSAAMQRKAEEGLVWTTDRLRAYLANPRAVVPGGSMTFVGLRDAAVLDDLLAYLREAGGAAR